MTPRKEITEELEQIGTELARLSPTLPYTVPSGYFQSFPEIMLRRIRSADTSEAMQELKEISPVLAGMDKKMPFSVPPGYFENMPLNIPSGQKPARVIALQSSRFFRYAAAAIVVGIISLVGWFIASRPDTAAEQYASAGNSATQVIDNIADISDSEISEFVDAGSLIYTVDPPELSGELRTEDLTLMLAEVSDDDLEKYLEMQNPRGVNIN